MVAIRNFAERHPQITAWIVLAIGMVIILVLSARQVGFTAGQWAALIVTTILLAGACVWIIGWGEDEEAEVGEPPTSNFEHEVGVEKAEASEAEGAPEANVSETGETESPD
jgi:hypothetical protein